ncbi:hypothetical protein LO763_18065 [Glycomyces sp. A-F 0318]|uniref:hypothetical protein n=1 Tax=Glycomyces amatae TaxID=2881355 RepID=UPI001E371165|nr:hypothetical protein [Glycomyces amatae]MCD0445522.1 hypothetical protein [Glycomyces amatae]
MTRIRQKSGSDLEDELIQFLLTTLPQSWEVDQALARRSESDHGYDFVIHGPDGSQTFVIVKTLPGSTTPAEIPRVVKRLRHAREVLEGQQAGAVLPVIVSNFISERARELLEKTEIGWFDSTGNVKLEAERPSLFIKQAGASRNPSPDTENRRQKSLKGPGAARVVRALLDGASDTRVRALAEHAGVGAATSARILGYLAQEHLVDRDERATVRRIHKRSLVQAWARDYHVMSTNHVTPVVVPRGLDWMTKQLVERRLPHVLAGSAALRRYLPKGVAALTPLSLLAVYSNDVPRLKRELRLRDAEYAANAVLLEPFDEVVLRGARESGGNRYTAPSQTVADLLTSPGRGPQEAEQLIETLADQDEEWTL